MTLKKYTLEGTAGGTITTVNSGLMTVTAVGGATALYQTGAVYQGTTGAEFIANGTNAAFAQAAFNASCTQGAVSFAFKVPASLPAADVTFGQIYDTANARVIGLLYTSSGAVKTNDKGNVQITVLTAAQASAGTWFRFEVVVTTLSTTAGAFTVRAYNSSGTQVGSTATSSTANTGTTAMNYLRFGQTGTAAFTVDIDSVQTDDTRTTEIGALTSNANPPTCTAGPNQTISSTGVGVNITCTAAADPSSAGIASYVWSLVSGITSAGATVTPTITNSTSQTASFTVPSKGRYIFQVIAIDAEGNQSAASTTRVFVPDSVFVPIAVTSSSGFASTTVANLQDASDATFVESGAPGSGSTLVLRLSPMVQATSGFDLDIRSLVQAVGGSQQVALLEGATVRKDWGAISPGTTFGDQHLTLTTTEMASVGSWNELDLQLTQV